MEVLLELRDVRRSFPDFELGPLSTRLARGRTCGLLGPNGAGKTTLLNLIGLQLRATTGEMVHDGTPIRWGERRWKSSITYIRETPAFYDALTVAATLRLVSRLYDTWDAAFAETLLSRFGLDARRRVGTLSKGTRVKLGLVAALAHRADLLILDEPTAGLDPGARTEMHDILRDLHREQPGLCILLSSHIFEDLEAVADDVLIMRKGRIVFACPRRELAALAVYRLPEDAMTDGLPDVRLAWRRNGHVYALAAHGSGVARFPGAVEEQPGSLLATVYHATEYLPGTV